MTAVQLDLPLMTEAQCPHCGHRAPVRAFLRRADVLADPRVDALSNATREFVRTAPESWLRGMPMGVSRLARWSGYTPQGARYHLLALVAARLVIPEPKRAGGINHVYRFDPDHASHKSVKTL